MVERLVVLRRVAAAAQGCHRPEYRCWKNAGSIIGSLFEKRSHVRLYTVCTKASVAHILVDRVAWRHRCARLFVGRRKDVDRFCADYVQVKKNKTSRFS
jgi:hypothetical protein